MTATPQRMDTSLTAIKDAIMAAQQDFQLDIGSFPQDAPRSAGEVLKELDGEVRRLISEFTRDAERPIGQAQNATPNVTGQTARRIKGIQDTHAQTSDSQYQAAKHQAAHSGKPLTQEMVRTANPNAQPKPAKKNLTQQLRQENAQLKQRVSILENTLRVHQIRLPSM